MSGEGTLWWLRTPKPAARRWTHSTPRRNRVRCTDGLAMTKEQETLEEVLASLKELPDAVLADVEKVAEALRELIRRHGPVAQFALALVGAEQAAADVE